MTTLQPFVPIHTKYRSHQCKYMLSPSFLYLISIISLGLLCQCTDMPEPRYVNRTIAPDFVREVPIIKEGRFKGYEDFFYKDINRNAFALQFDSSEAGYDSLQIRIWLGHSMAKVKHVVILKYKDQKWKAQLVGFKMKMGEKRAHKKVKGNSSFR